MVYVAPSILSADFACLLQEVKRMEEAGADWLHVDVMDGHFVPNITMGPLVVKALSGRTSLFLDVHLMVQDPRHLIVPFWEAGAQLITVHAESTPHLHRLVQSIKDCGCMAGVALNPATPLSSLDYVLDLLDLVLIMSVNPGFGGQEFIRAVVPKIEELSRKVKGKKDLFIQVDGGINEITAIEVIEAGANVLVSGSTLFGCSEPGSVIKDFKSCGERAGEKNI